MVEGSTFDLSGTDGTFESTEWYGLEINPNRDLIGFKVELLPAYSDTTIRIHNPSTGTTLAEEGPYQGGDVVTIDAEMASGTSYWLEAASSQTAAYTGDDAYPYTFSDFDVPNGSSDNGGTTTNAAYAFDYVTAVYGASPNAPANLSASASGDDISLSWDTVTEEDGYRIYRSQSSGGSYTEVGSVGADSTTYTDVNPPDGERYYYRVTAYNEYGESDPSNEAAATTALPAPSNVSVSIDTPTSGTVTWQDNSDNEDNIRVVLYEDGDWTDRWDPSPNSESQSITFSESADELQVRVRAETDHTTSDWTYSNTYQTTVTNVAVTGIDETDVTLSWSGTDQEDEYRVFRAEASGSTESDYVSVGTTTSTSLTDSGRENGERYYYRTTAVYGGETGELSGEVAATTDLPAASDVTFDTSVEDEITVSWSKADDSPDGTWELYRSTDGSLGTQLTTFSDLSQTTYTDTGRADGEKYYYTVRRSTEHATSDAQQAAVALLPATTDLAAPAHGAATVDLVWTAHHDNGQTRIDYKPTDASSWTAYDTVSRDVESVTVDGLRNGERYDLRPVAVTNHTEAADTIQVRTDLPDEDQPVLGNGVEDEVAVDREDTVSNYGSVRIQIRETGETSWDASATGFGEFIGAHDTLTMEFVDRKDGEEYEVRARVETEHVTGAWTDPVSITTVFPGVTGLAITGATKTAVDLEGTDNADNEDGIRIERQREYSTGWGRWREIQDWSPNDGTGTFTIVDDSASPGNTYRYRAVPYTEHTAASSEPTSSVTTPESGRPRTRTGSTGWYVEVDHPEGATLRPRVLSDGVQRQPRLKARPRIDLPVPKSPKWEGDHLDDADMRVWKDGRRLPISSLEATSREDSRDVLHGVGADELDQHLTGVQFDERESHLAAREVIEDELGMTANVDDPATNTRDRVRMQSAEFTPEFEEELEDPSAPVAADIPLQVFGSLVEPEQTGWFREAEATENNAGTYIASVEGDPGAWSGDQALRLVDAGDELSFEFSTQHVIPQGEAKFSLVFANPDVNPAYTVSIETGTSGMDVVETIPEDTMPTSTGLFDLIEFDVTLNQDGDLPEGVHTIRVEVTSSVSEGMYLDFCHARDDRYPYEPDLNPVDEVVTGWWQYPTLDLLFRPVSSVDQVTGGYAELDISDTTADQAIALRNGTNDWQEAQNTDSVTVEEFASGEQSIQLRVTLGGHDTGTRSGEYRASPQELHAVELSATLEDTPVLMAKDYSGSGADILNRIAETGAFIWAVEWDDDRGEPVVEWTQPGQRTTDRELAVVEYEGRRTIAESYQRIIVNGESNRVEDDRFQQSEYGAFIGLSEQHIQPGSETVYDPGDPNTVYKRGIDYGMWWEEGAVELLEGGSMEPNTMYAVDYDWTIQGEYTVPAAESPRTREVEVPEASSRREASQFARGIVKDVQDPLEEAVVTISRVEPGWSLVEALAGVDLPFEGPLEIREMDEQSDQPGAQLRLGSRQSVEEAVSELRDQIDAVAREV